MTGNIFRAVSRVFFALAGFACFANTLSAAPIQWTVGSGGNDHYYERIEAAGLTYDQAALVAAGSSFSGLPGHFLILEEADYANELNFVNTNVYSPGVDSNRIYWVGAKQLSGEPDWKWVDGSTVPVAIRGSWNIDHFEGPGDYGAAFFQPNTTLWDYITTNTSGFVNGYVVEYQPVPEPSTLAVATLSVLGLLIVTRRK
jgi:hypothetical protein